MHEKQYAKVITDLEGVLVETLVLRRKEAKEVKLENQST